MVHHQRGSTYAIGEAEATVPRNLVGFFSRLKGGASCFNLRHVPTHDSTFVFNIIKLVHVGSTGHGVNPRQVADPQLLWLGILKRVGLFIYVKT